MHTQTVQGAPLLSRFRTRTTRGVVVLIGAVLIHITLGVLYCFGNFSPYLVSFIRERTSNKDTRYSNMSWILNLMVIGQGSTMALGGLMERRIGSRLTIVTGCCILTASTLLSYFSIHSFYTLILTYGILFGCGIGIAYSTAMTLSMKWLPRFKGLVAGSVVAGFGLGAMVFNPVITVFINPNNTSPEYAPYPNKTTEKYFTSPDDDAILDRVPYCFLVMGGFFAVLQCTGTLLLKNAQPHYEDLYEEERTSSTITGTSADEVRLIDDDNDDCTPQEMMRNKDFWLLWLGFLCNVQGVTFFSINWKSFGQGFISNDLFLASVGSAGSIANAASRIMWGSIGDRFHFKHTMLVLQSLFVVLYLSMSYISHIGNGKWSYAVFVFLVFACIGGSFSLYPAVTIKKFGTTHSTANYGILFTSSIVGSLVMILLTNEVQNNVTDQQMQWVISAFIFCGIICTCLFQLRCGGGDDDRGDYHSVNAGAVE